MKRFLFLLIFSIVSFSPSLWAKSNHQNKTPSFQPFTGRVLGNKVRMRLAPNLEGHIVKEVAKGDIFAIVGQQEDYYAIAPTKDVKAYIFRTHVLDNTVEGDRVNVRLEPNLEAPILTQLNSGDRVNIHLNEVKGKWLEIDLPKDVHFWVAKDYIENIGPAEYAAKYQERLVEAKQLLATANLISQAEFRKPFKEIDLTRVTKNFERVLTDYSDLEDVHNQAKVAIQSLQKDYCDKKIAYLETKAGSAALEVETLNAKLTHLQSPENYTSDVTSNHESPFKEILTAKNTTDKMKIWAPLEYALFQSWAINTDKDQASLQDFYQEEFLSSRTLSGIVESFDKTVKNKPGDYLIKQPNGSTAYLYSTHVNLQDFIGKKVKVKASQRDNHNFAFPAYYVLEVIE